jgi:FixJ family two-component response regulator
LKKEGIIVFIRKPGKQEKILLVVRHVAERSAVKAARTPASEIYEENFVWDDLDVPGNSILWHVIQSC